MSTHPVGTVHILKREDGKPTDSWWVCRDDAEFAAKAKEAQARMAAVSSREYRSRPEATADAFDRQ